jgi:chromosomal replication initiation ATPase DnaA
MNISSHHIQNVIRAYGQRVERRSLARLKAASQPAPRGPDSISISSAARQKQITQKITSDILARAGKDVSGKVSEKVVERLGNEFGGTIDLISSKEKEKNFRFRVISDKIGEEVKELTPEDITKVVERLYDMVDKEVMSDKKSL